MAQNTMGPIIGNYGIVTQGQQGNNTIIQSAVARQINSAEAEGLKAQILRELPKDKPITVTAVIGDSEAIQFGYEIEPNGISQGVFSGAVKGLGRRDDPDGGITFIVGSNQQ